MPKQVRLRRGTTAQHASFTGADGEVTFDTTKKALVVHDGVTAGGLPVDGYVKLAPGSLMAEQNIQSRLTISGGDDDSDAFTVTQKSQFYGTMNCDDLVLARRFSLQQEGLVYAANIALNFGSFGQKRIDLTGNLTLTTNNVANGRNLFVRLKADPSTRTLTFPAGWHWIGGAAPASLAANKIALLWLWAWGDTDADITARYLVEP